MCSSSVLILFVLLGHTRIPTYVLLRLVCCSQCGGWIGLVLISAYWSLFSGTNKANLNKMTLDKYGNLHDKTGGPLSPDTIAKKVSIESQQIELEKRQGAVRHKVDQIVMNKQPLFMQPTQSTGTAQSFSPLPHPLLDLWFGLCMVCLSSHVVARGNAYFSFSFPASIIVPCRDNTHDCNFAADIIIVHYLFFTQWFVILLQVSGTVQHNQVGGGGVSTALNSEGLMTMTYQSSNVSHYERSNGTLQNINPFCK